MKLFKHTCNTYFDVNRPGFFTPRRPQLPNRLKPRGSRSAGGARAPPDSIPAYFVHVRYNHERRTRRREGASRRFWTNPGAPVERMSPSDVPKRKKHPLPLKSRAHASYRVVHRSSKTALAGGRAEERTGLSIPCLAVVWLPGAVRLAPIDMGDRRARPNLTI